MNKMEAAVQVSDGHQAILYRVQLSHTLAVHHKNLTQKNGLGF